VKALPDIALRAGRGRKKGGAREVWRLLDQRDERWRITRNADHLHGFAFEAHFGDKSMIGQNL